MAETLRELVVSLSLNSSNFDQNIKSVNQRIKEAESNFQLAAAGVNGFDNSMRGAATRVSMLKQKLDLQNQAVTQFEQKLAKASAALEKSRASTDKQATSLATNKRAHEQLVAEIQKTEAAYKESAATVGDNEDATNELGLKLIDLKAKEKALSEEIKNGEAKLDAATKTVQRNDDAVSKAQTGLNNAKAAVKATRNELNLLTNGLGTAGAALGILAAKAITAGQSMSRAGRTLAMRVTAPLVALGAYAIKSAMDFESAFAGVRKTVNATEEEFARLEQSIKDMSLEVPSSTTAIAGVMEIAGQLGIATENLESFSRTIIDLANTTNLSAEEAATALAQFANVTGMSQGDANKFGSALVDLGNNFATTERDIMNMATRLAAAGSQVGLSESQILGFATALASVGLEAEAGGTAFSKVMTKMEVAVATGKNGLADFAKVSGMSQKDFVAQWKAEPAKAIEAFIVGLSKMDEEGISAIATLEDMGLKEVRLRDTLLRATNATELFAEAQATAASAWGEGSALATEANVRYETMASQLEILKNRVSLAAQSLGAELAPMAKRVMEAIGGLIDRFMALDTNQKEQIIKWAAIAAAVGPALIVLGKLTSGAGRTVQAVLSITRALKGLSMVQMGWIGAAVVAVAGLAAAIKLASDASESADKTLGRLFNNYDRDTVEELNAAFDVQIETVVSVDDYKAKINAAIQGIKDILMESGEVTEEEQAAIITAIANKTGLNLLNEALVGALPEINVQPAIDAITNAQASINATLEGLGLSEEARAKLDQIIAEGGDADQIETALLEFGVNPALAEIAAESISDSAQKINEAIADLGLSEANQSKLQALIDAGAGQNEIEQALISYGVEPGTAAEAAATISREMGVIDTAVNGLKLSEKAAGYIRSLIESGAGRAEIIEALVSFGVPEGAAASAVDSILAEMGKVSTAVAGLGLSEEARAHVTTMAKAGATTKEIIAALESYGILGDAAKETASAITGEMDKIDTVVKGLKLSKEAAAHIGMLVSQNASAEEIAAALRSYGIEPDAANEAAGKITESMGKIDTTVAELGLDPAAVDALENSVLGDKEALITALVLLGLTDEDIAPIIASYDLLADSLPAKIAAAINSAYQQLTDGLADTPAVMAGIKEDFDKAFQESIDAINASAEAKIAELDPTAGDYQTKVDEIRRIQQEHTDAVTGYQKDAWGIIAGLANASKGEVDAAWVHIEELLTQAGLLVAQYDELEGRLNQTRQGEVAVVKAGAARDPKTAISALGYVDQQYKLDTKAIQDEYDTKMAELNANFDDKNTEAYITAADAAATAYEAANAARLEEYRVELAEMWAGLADSLADMEPELAAKLLESVTALDLETQVQNAIDQLDAGTLDATALTDGVVKAIADAVGIAYTSKELLGLDFETINSFLEAAKVSIDEKIIDVFSGDANLGWLDEVMQSSIEKGLFAPFDDLDVTDPKQKARIAMGDIGQGAVDGLTEKLANSSDTLETAGGDMAESTVKGSKDAFESNSPSKVYQRMGGDLVDGLILGVQNSTWKLRLAMAAMAREAIKAAKIALGIASPSKLFRDEIGRMMVRGVSLGVELETDQQRRTIANAARLMTASARDGVRSEASRITNDSRNQSVNVNIDNVNANSKQDIETLAQRLSALNLRRSRGYGY